MQPDEEHRLEVLSHWLAHSPWEWRKLLLLTKLSPGVKVVGFAIADWFLNRNEALCYPTYETIAARCDMTERGVRAAVAALVEAGFLTKKKVKFRGPNRLRLSLSQQVAQSVTALPLWLCGTAVTDSEPARPCRTIRHDDDAQTGTAMTVNLSLEPSLEPSTIDSILEASDDGYLPGIDYGSIDPSAPWPDGLVRRANSTQDPMTFIGRAAISIQGFKLGHNLPSPKIGDRFADEALMALFPKPALAEMARRCRAGTLKQRHVAMALQALSAPRA
jgi:hypothetical protein